MSYLDELKKQAQSKTAQHAENQSKTLQKHEINWHQLAPKAYQIFNYLKDLAGTLNDVNPQDLCSYHLTKDIEIKNLKKNNFRIAKNDKDSIRSFSFRFDLANDRDFQLVFNNVAMLEKMKQLLTDHVIKFTEIMENQNRILLTIKPLITAHFDFTADVVNSVFMLKIHNFEGAWSQTVRLPPDLISDSLIDEIAKYMLHKPNKFMEKLGYTVSDDVRAKLQEKLQRGKPPQSQMQPEGKTEKTQNKFMGLFKK